MAAERRPSNGVDDESGQSVLEFLLMLPLMLGLTALTLRMNMAIQMSIVNQQYARAQAFHLTFHSPYYPEAIGARRENGFNQMVMGVSENLPESEGEAGEYQPEASVAVVARNRRLANRPGGAQEQPRERSHVRVRNTVTLCTASHFVVTDRGRQPADANTLREGVSSRSFAYCRGALDE